jgi:hypothetical protein
VFKKDLAERLKAIFDLDKVTFDKPGESQEQECAFVVIDNAVCRVSDAKSSAKVTGTLVIYANSDKLPYGYFAKQIEKADPSQTGPIFFYNFEENSGMEVNIVERRANFLYLFDSQYDPAIGTLTQVNLSISETS